MAEEETGAKDGDIRKKVEEVRRKKMKPADVDAQELLTKAVQIKMKDLHINLI
jgi:hypothetical protein